MCSQCSTVVARNECDCNPSSSCENSISSGGLTRICYLQNPAKGLEDPAQGFILEIPRSQCDEMRSISTRGEERSNSVPPNRRRLPLKIRTSDHDTEPELSWLAILLDISAFFLDRNASARMVWCDSSGVSKACVKSRRDKREKQAASICLTAEAQLFFRSPLKGHLHVQICKPCLVRHIRRANLGRYDRHKLNITSPSFLVWASHRLFSPCCTC